MVAPTVNPPPSEDKANLPASVAKPAPARPSLHYTMVIARDGTFEAARKGALSAGQQSPRKTPADPEGFWQLTEECPLMWPNYCVEGMVWQFTTAVVKLAKVFANVA